jgi:hypothetical protein
MISSVGLLLSESSSNAYILSSLLAAAAGSLRLYLILPSRVLQTDGRRVQEELFERDEEAWGAQ